MELYDYMIQIERDEAPTPVRALCTPPGVQLCYGWFNPHAMAPDLQRPGRLLRWFCWHWAEGRCNRCLRCVCLRHGRRPDPQVPEWTCWLCVPPVIDLTEPEVINLD